MLMTKRRFIIALITGLLAARGWGTKVLAAGIFDESIEAVVGNLFSDVTDAQVIGRRYLTLYPEKANRGVLLAELKMTYPLLAGHWTQLKKALYQRRQQQFLESDTVIIDGWILARCEAQLCALLALS
jgi:hypothetical protein